jgi:large subunit ribosomal protein L25
MMKHALKAVKRSVTGRKVKTLRKEGIVPGNIFGKKITSLGVQIPEKLFAGVFAKAGETGIVELDVDGKIHPVLIHNIQVDPVSGITLHVDFYQVDLKEKITAKIPLAISGEAPAVKDKIGVLLTILSDIEVEALPAELPEKIVVDVTVLTALDQSVKVEQLKVDKGVKILTDGTLDVVKIAPLVSKEAEKMAAQEAAAAAAAAAAAQPAATEAPGATQTAQTPQAEPTTKDK